MRAAECVEEWALGFIETRHLADKVAPAEPPTRFSASSRLEAPSAPGRPERLTVVAESPRTPGADALRDPKRRARLLHTFWHHELQAAELMCWAILRYPETETSFRAGLLRICLDEVRHMRLYQNHIEALGYRLGDFPVRDWFWERVPSCRSPEQFVALMGMGLEAANLEHSRDFAARFRAAGDETAAAIQEAIGREEVGHVAFATHWFRRFTGGCRFSVWRASLPAPLSPLLMRGAPLERERRLAAGLDERFVEELERWTPSGS